MKKVLLIALIAALIFVNDASATVRILNTDFVIKSGASLISNNKNTRIYCLLREKSNIKIGLITKKGKVRYFTKLGNGKVVKNKRIISRKALRNICEQLVTSGINSSTSSYSSSEESTSSSSSSSSQYNSSATSSSSSQISSTSSSIPNSSSSSSSAISSSSSSFNSSTSSSSSSQSSSTSTSSSSSSTNSSSSSSNTSSSSSSKSSSSSSTSSQSSSSNSSDPCGVQIDGYQGICTVTQLDQIRLNPSGKYRLMNNIDLKGFNWVPIPSANSTGIFNGIFDGNHMKIFNLQGSSDNFALFSRNEGEIKNLVISGINVNAQQFVAGLALQNAGIIRSVMTVGSYTVVSGYVGGLVVINQDSGVIEDSTGIVNISRSRSDTYGQMFAGIAAMNRGVIQRSASHGQINISGPAAAIGGLVGQASPAPRKSYQSLINSTLSDVNVSTYTNTHGRSIMVGGLIGSFFTNPVIVTNSEARGDIIAGIIAGGLVGFADGAGGNTTSLISNCKASGDVTGGAELGGLVGYSSGELYIKKSTSNGNVTALAGILPQCINTATNEFGYCAEGVGGIIGTAKRTYIEKSSYTGTIDTSDVLDNIPVVAYTGGIAGFVSTGTVGATVESTIVDSYSNSNIISGSSHKIYLFDTDGRAVKYGLGGIVGLAAVHPNIPAPITLKRVYQGGGRIFNPIDPLSGQGTVGAYIVNSGQIIINSSYWDKTYSPGLGSGLGGSGKTTDEMHHATTFSGWDFSTTGPWKINEGLSYPSIN